MKVAHYNQFLIEKSIGSEEIRKKWYSTMDKKEFYNIVNIDPTSVRKKNFSKPGKYTKWLLSKYKEWYDFHVKYHESPPNSDYVSKLNYMLFIFSTGWYQTKVRKSSYSLGGTVYKTIENDILKFKSISSFMLHMGDYLSEFKKDTEDAKFDVVYFDENINILVPINFTASAVTAKNTQWCSSSYSGYSAWNKISILFRIMPKDTSYDKVKLTWTKRSGYDNRWYMACSKYPEFNGEGNPFEVTNGKELWEKTIDETTNYDSLVENGKIIKKTMKLVSNKAKSTIIEYYNKIEKG